MYKYFSCNIRKSFRNIISITKVNFNTFMNNEHTLKINNNSKFEITMNIKQFRNKYQKDDIENQSHYEENKIIEKIGGRILSIRKMSKNLTFVDLNSNGENLQIVFDIKKLDENEITQIKNLKRGFIVGLEGSPFYTKTGELSLLATKINILSECEAELPIMNRKDKEMLKDHELRYSKRYLDLIVNNNHKEYFEFRAKLIRFLRNYLENEGFLEVETPILSHKVGGALARPFQTHSNALKNDLFLRIAPELYLKQLIIAGFEKVFEIGKNFRNEDISVRHNPEFTTCEFYHTYSDYLKLITFTKNFLIKLSQEIFESKSIKCPIDFKEENFKIFDFKTEFENYFNRKLNFNSREEFYNQCEEFYLEFTRQTSIPNLNKNFNLKMKLEKMIELIIESKCKEGCCFIINHPTILSPLAKSHADNKLLSERFEFYINGIEIINSYSELNDAKEQRERFVEQKNLSENGLTDNEIHPFDNDFLEALSYGMPPTAGWGLGIDRLCMMLLGLQNIKEVILFPLMNVNKI